MNNGSEHPVRQLQDLSMMQSIISGVHLISVGAQEKKEDEKKSRQV